MQVLSEEDEAKAKPRTMDGKVRKGGWIDKLGSLSRKAIPGVLVCMAITASPRLVRLQL